MIFPVRGIQPLQATSLKGLKGSCCKENH